MEKEKINGYFETENRAKKLNTVTFAMFCFLAFCVPITIGLEAAKFYVAEHMYTYPLYAEVFMVMRSVINETVLDLPYALLILLIFFTHENKNE